MQPLTLTMMFQKHLLFYAAKGLSRDLYALLNSSCTLVPNIVHCMKTELGHLVIFGELIGPETHDN